MGFDELRVTTEDEAFMLEALKEADKAFQLGEVPVGAVIVQNGEIVSRAHNLVETNKSSSAHAEMLAISGAEERLSAKWLAGATIYVTLEPCSMCAGAMVLARLKRVVIGALDPKTGACGSVLNIVSCNDFNHKIDVTTGVLAEECSNMLKEFFHAKRTNK